MAQAIREVNKSSGKVTAAIKEHIVSELVGKDLNQTQVIVSAALNIPVKESTKTKHQKDESVRLEITLTKVQWAKFNQAKELISNSLPNGSWDQVIESMSDFVILKKDKATPKKERASNTMISEVKASGKIVRSAIPKSIQRAVIVRDTCCQYQSKITGHKCSSSWNLNLDHIKPFWAGGTNTVDNLRVFCASHNAQMYREQAGIRFV